MLAANSPALICGHMVCQMGLDSKCGMMCLRTSSSACARRSVGVHSALAAISGGKGARTDGPAAPP
eukprot:scaffold37189_cov31-Tisochrysis_lutea.AAC.2